MRETCGLRCKGGPCHRTPVTRGSFEWERKTGTEVRLTAAAQGDQGNAYAACSPFEMEQISLVSADKGWSVPPVTNFACG